MPGRLIGPKRLLKVGRQCRRTWLFGFANGHLSRDLSRATRGCPAYATGFEDATSRHRGARVASAIIGSRPHLFAKTRRPGEDRMPDSVYTVIELVGTSTTSWEDARVGPTGAVVGVDLNPGMLSVARSAVSTDSQSSAPLQWQEANADKLPFPDESFDIVYCQLGLQFFADRAGALREMRRVLGAEGRLALMVWRGIHESPGFAALAESLERHISQAAAAIMRAPFGLSNADQLADLVRAAGFQDVAIQQRLGTVRFPSVEMFVLSYVAGSPLAGPVSQANDAAHGALTTDVRNALEKYTSNTELAFPIAAHLLSARV